MDGDQIRRLALVVARYGVVYAGVATAGAYAASTVVAASFDTVLFVVFAVTAVLVAVGAMGGRSSSNDALHSGAGFTGTSNPGERWETGLLVKLVLFGAGLATVLTVHALWWAR